MVVEASIFYDILHTCMDFYGTEKPLFDVSIGVPALKALPGRLDSGLQQAALSAGDSEANLLCEYAVPKEPIYYDPETHSEDFISNFDAAPDMNDYSEEKCTVSYAKDSHSLNRNLSSSSSAEGEPEDQTILRKVSHLDKGPQKRAFQCSKTPVLLCGRFKTFPSPQRR